MKALELANELDAVPENGADPELIQEVAAELRRLAAVDAERDALKAGFERTLAECRDAYPVPEVGSELEDLWGQALGDPVSVGAYVKACATSQKKEIDELRAELERIKANPVHQWRNPFSSDPSSYSWNDGRPDHTDGGGPYETRTLYALGSKT